MKKKIILISIFIVLIIVANFFVFNALFKENKKDEAPFYNIRYESQMKDACLTFYDNGKYSMYDCDSEPTNYYFDNENECSYVYLKKENKIKFTCHSSVWDKPEFSIDVLEWTNKIFKFKYEDKEETFKFDEKVEEIGEEEDIIPYVLYLDKYYIDQFNNKMYLNSDGTFTLKKCDKKCITYFGVMDHTDNSMNFYYEKKKVEGKKWEKYKLIQEANITDANTFKIKDSVFELMYKK